MLTICWGCEFICGDVMGTNCGETVFDGVDPELETRDAITSSLPGKRFQLSGVSLAQAYADGAQITARSPLIVNIMSRGRASLRLSACFPMLMLNGRGRNLSRTSGRRAKTVDLERKFFE